MLTANQILKKTGIREASFRLYRSMGLVSHYAKKQAIGGKGGFQYLYPDKVVQEIEEVERERKKGKTLPQIQKERWAKDKDMQQAYLSEYFIDIPIKAYEEGKKLKSMKVETERIDDNTLRVWIRFT